MKEITSTVLSLVALLILSIGTSLAASKDGCCNPSDCCKPGSGCCYGQHQK